MSSLTDLVQLLSWHSSHCAQIVLVQLKLNIGLQIPQPG